MKSLLKNRLRIASQRRIHISYILVRRVCGAVLVAVVCAATAHAQQRPLLTEDVDIIPPGSARIEVGIDFLQNAKFPLSGLTGDLTRVGVIGLNVGLAPNVEVQLEGTLQNYLSINSAMRQPPIPLGFAPGTSSTNDTGDFTLSTKIKLRNETRHAPSLGFRFGVQLPNSNEAQGIGQNQTNAYGTVLFGKKFGREGRLNAFGNIGIGILSTPLETFTQNDVLLYGLAGIFRFNNQINFVGEVNGRANTRGRRAPLGTEPQGEARLGLQFKASNLRFDFAGIAGLTDFSQRSGVTFGVTFDTPSIFTPVR